MRKPQPGADDEDLGELPPLDGESEDSEDRPDALDRHLDVPSDDGGPEDDEVAEDATPDDGEIGVDQEEPSWLNEEPDASTLDLGPVALVDLGQEVGSGDDDRPGEVEEDGEVIEDRLEPILDSGDEGPLAPDEDLRDEDLPSLDADDDGEGADTAFVDAGFAADEPLGLEWASRPWPRVGAPLGLSGATAVVCAGRCAVVAFGSESGERQGGLVQVDLEGSRTTLPAAGLDGSDVDGLANDGTESGTVAVVLRGGLLATSRDGGAHFQPDVSGIARGGCVVALGRVWAPSQTGALLTTSGPGRVEILALPGSLVAIASDGGAHLVALLRSSEDKAPALARIGPDLSFSLERIAFDCDGTDGKSFEPTVHAILAARARSVAYTARGGVVRRNADGRWQRFDGWDGRVTAMTFVDDDGTLLAAAYSDVEDTTGLVRIDPSGNLSVVARIGAMRDQGDSDGRVVSLACDDTRGVVWVAGGFGVAAFSMGVD
jgi:hypothetical protein